VCTQNGGVSAEQKLTPARPCSIRATCRPSNCGCSYQPCYVYYYSKQDFDRAIQDYDEALRPWTPPALGVQQRALAYLKKSDTTAPPGLRPGGPGNPKFAMTYVNRGNALRTKGATIAPSRTSTRRSGLSANLTAAYFGRALAYQDKAQYDSDAYLNEGRYEDRAIADYDKVIGLDPNSRGASTTGQRYLNKRNTTVALADSTRRSGSPPTTRPMSRTRQPAADHGSTIAPSRTIARRSELKLEEPMKKQIERR